MAAACGTAALATTSTAIYPPPIKTVHRSAAIKFCPNPEGLEPFTKAIEASARRTVEDYGRASLATKLANSDRSWQPEIRATGSNRTSPPHEEVVGSQSGTRSPYSIIVSYACGAGLVRKSLEVVTAPSRNAPCNACRTGFWIIDRRGRALIYFVYP